MVDEIKDKNITTLDDALKALIFNAPETNHDAKITFLKQEIAEGRYEIDSKRIASLLMQTQKKHLEPETA